jgi:hypothetical protein
MSSRPSTRRTLPGLAKLSLVCRERSPMLNRRMMLSKSRCSVTLAGCLNLDLHSLPMALIPHVTTKTIHSVPHTPSLPPGTGNSTILLLSSPLTNSASSIPPPIHPPFGLSSLPIIPVMRSKPSNNALHTPNDRSRRSRVLYKERRCDLRLPRNPRSLPGTLYSMAMRRTLPRASLLLNAKSHHSGWVIEERPVGTVGFFLHDLARQLCPNGFRTVLRFR